MILAQKDTTHISEAIEAALPLLEAEEKVKFAPATAQEAEKIWRINYVGQYLTEQRQRSRKR
jgi:hypothetical protein